jgi:carbon-monoxide dehydrogenase medium subunit
MKAAAFAYVRADDVAHAVELLAADPDNTRVLAGGQSLGPMLNLRLARPSTLIDIKRVPSLRGLEADDRMLRLGACWTHA